MILFAVDDEPPALRLLKKAILEAEPRAELHTFSCDEELLEAMNGDCPHPDVVFLDIELPGIGGIELAKTIKSRSPKTWIVFVTGFSQYAVEAYSIQAKGYIMKPPTAERIRQELEAPMYEPLPGREKRRVRVHTFGTFEVFVDDTPLHFRYSKTKELFAFLVDREGALCAIGDIIAALWEDDSKEKRYSYMRTLRSDLLGTFAKAGCMDVFLRQRGKIAVIPEKIDCDYYRWTKGDPNVLNAYRGEYMTQYSWGEETLGKIEQTRD